MPKQMFPRSSSLFTWHAWSVRRPEGLVRIALKPRRLRWRSFVTRHLDDRGQAAASISRMLANA
jgi:hypothetical protein